MSKPSVAIVANPYEGELCRRALGNLDLTLLPYDGGEGASALVGADRPLLVVVADGLYSADARGLLTSLRQARPGLPIFFIADRDGDVPNEDVAVALGATRLFLRPIDAGALADAIEQVAVEAELSDEVGEQLASVSGAVEMEADFAAGPEASAEASAASEGRIARVSQAPTLVESEAGGARGAIEGFTSPPARRQASGVIDTLARARRKEPLLRADDALADAAGLAMSALSVHGAVARSPERPPLEERPAPVRRLEDALSAAERRLFADAPSSFAAPEAEPDDDEGLSDLDLDAIGLDTIPAIPTDVRAEPGARTTPEITPLAVRAVEPVDEEGSLRQVDLAQLVAALYRSDFTGRLVLSREDGAKAIHFDGGAPVFASSSYAHDRLGELLYREGKLGRVERAQTRNLDAEPGRRSAARLVELGLLKSSELFSSVRRHTEEVYYSCFAWQDAHYRLEVGTTPSEDKVRLSLHPAALVVEAIRRKYGLERLVDRVGPAATVLERSAAFAKLAGLAGLSAAEQLAASLVDGTRSIGELRRAAGPLPNAGLSEAELYGLYWGLIVVGALRRKLGPELQDANQEEETGERRAPTRPQLGEEPYDHAIDRERLLAKHAQARDGDYFSILGLDRMATRHEVSRAYARTRGDFAAERFVEPMRSELGAALAEVHEVIEEAYRVLHDDELRAAYRDHLVDG